MITRHTYNNLTWIDLASPSKEEIKELIHEFKFHPTIGEELLSPTLKPQVDLYDDFIYLILHFPTIKHTHNSQVRQEIDFIIGKNVLITTRYDTIDAIDKFRRVFETNIILNEAPIGEHAGFLFYYLIRKLYRSLTHELEYVESNLEHIERHIFEGNEKDMVVELSHTSRELIDFQKALGYHKDVLDSLTLAGTTFFGNDFAFYLKRIIDEHRRIEHQLKGEQLFLRELRDTNDSLLSTKQNEVMKTLTIMAFVTFPLTLVAALFGMNTLTTPVIGHSQDFWLVVGIMLLLTALMFTFFKYKKWL